MHPTTGACRKAHGFSLLELLAVLALLAVVGGIGVLQHRAARPGLDLTLAAQRLVMDLQAARLHAVTQHRDNRIVFSAGSDRYRPQVKQEGEYRDVGGAVVLPRGIVVAGCTAANASVTFRPRGNAASFGTVTLRNERGEARRVVIDIAGLVRVE